MPKADPIFPTFASGEVSPLVYGRVDLQQYFNGLELAENTLPRPYGLIINRPGLEFIAPAKFDDKETRLLEFVFNEADSFQIEFGDLYFRFYTLGGAVTEGTQAILAATQADPVELEVTTHGYSVDDEFLVAGIVGMTELNNKRFRVNTVPDADHITLKDRDGNTIDGTAFNAYISGGTVDKIFEIAHTYTEAELFDVHYAQVNDVINIAHGDHAPATLTRLASNNWVLADINFVGGPVQDENTTAVTIDPSADTGLGITLVASASTFQVGHIGSIWKINEGFVKITAFASDVSVTADVQGTDDLNTGPAPTLVWSEASWSDVAGFPATVTFHERRRWWARTRTEPQTQWASKPFIFDDYTVGPNADDALNLRLNTEQANDIKWMSSGAVLATGTFGGEFITSSGTQGISLTPDNANATRQTGWGSVNIQPKKIANFVYYVQRAGRKIRELFYYWDLDTYKSVDQTILSEHITKSGVTSIAYQQNPDSTLWCILENGQIATYVREEDQQMKGWSRQTTDGLFKSVGSNPSNLGPYDEVWTIIDREINGTTRKYIERFENPEIPDRQEECFFVDSGLTLNVYNSTTGISLTLTALTGTNVTATSGSAKFESNDVGQRIRAIDPITGDFVGELVITGFLTDTTVIGDVTFDFDALAYSGNEWGVSVTTISGLDHLEAKTVKIMADGAVQTDRVVANGQITLELDAFEASIGLFYRSFIVTLSIEAGSNRGTAQGKLSRIHQLGLRVNRTLGIKVGGSVDKLFLTTLRQPAIEMGRPIPLFTGIIPNIPFTGGWVIESKIVVVQDEPLPMQILDLMPLMQTSDK